MNLQNIIKSPRAKGRIVHSRARNFFKDPVTGLYIIPDPESYEVLFDDESHNVVTTAGVDFTFVQTYSTSTGANGLNYIALSNDALTENSASTTLSNEIAANGLTRAIGVYNHTNGQATATIAKTFTATGSQSAQKAALFSASSGGSMNHVLAFSAQRSLVNTDTLAVTFTITIS